MVKEVETKHKFGDKPVSGSGETACLLESAAAKYRLYIVSGIRACYYGPLL